MKVSHNNSELNTKLTATTGASTTRRGLLLGASALGFFGANMVPMRALAQTAIDPETIPGPSWAGGAMGGRGINVWGDSRVDFDPLLAYGRADYYNLANFFRGLTYLSVGSEPQLDLASSVEISADGLVYTFKLRDGIMFHHGRQAVAEDFRWSIERAVSPEKASWVQGFMTSVVGYDDFVAGAVPGLAGLGALDDRTIVITLSKPDARLLSTLGIPPFYVLPRDEVERLGDEFLTHPVGTGPYKWVSYDGANNQMIAARFEDYIYHGHLPYLDEIEVRWNVTSDIQYLQVVRGDADLSLGIPASVVPDIMADAALAERFATLDALDVSWWAFSVTKPPFNDVRVRQAVNLAFDRSRASVFGINPTGHLLPPSLLGFSDSAPIYAHDPDRARALLAEAGLTDLELKIGVFGATSGVSVRIAQLIAQDLEAVGIRTVLEQRQETAFDIGSALSDEYDMWNMGWGMGLPDPSELTASLFGTGGAANFGGYSNPALDAKALDAISITDRDVRAVAYAEIEAELLRDAPFLFVGVAQLNSLRSARLQNFAFDAALWTYWDRYWVAGA